MSAKSEQTSLVFVTIKSRMHQAISQLKHNTNVESVTPVTGRFDAVVKLRTNDPEKAFNAVEKIREIDDVTATQTGLSLQHVSSPHEGEREQPIAFSLMKVKGTISEILHKLKSFPNFLEANVIPGEFDIVAAFRGHNPKEVLETSVDKIGSINGITANETLISWNPTTSESRQ